MQRCSGAISPCANAGVARVRISSGEQDPKEIITPDAFSVAPELLGTPLAHPWRRAAAMSVDLIAIAVIGQIGWTFLGLAVAFLLLRRAFGRRAREVGGLRVLAAVGGVLVLAGTLAGTWLSCSDGEEIVQRELSEAIVGTSLGDMGGTVREAMTIARGEDEAEVGEAARSFVQRLERQGVAAEEIRASLEELAAERSEPWARAAILSALDGVEAGGEAAALDSLVMAYAQALRDGDSAGAAQLREPVTEALAAERLGRQERRIVRLQRENERLEDELGEEEERGLLSLLFRMADEVGLGFGWAGLYFTLFVVVWGGRTPGKRLLGIRILRLDGKPIGWWVAFNRFGGYAASVFTGLLGFFEMLWDANRQALHDRIAATVVVRDHAGRSAGPATAATKHGATTGAY